MRVAAVAASLAALVLPVNASAAAKPVDAPSRAELADRLIVTYEGDASARARRVTLGQVDGEEVVGRIAALDVAVLELEPGDSTAALATLNADPTVSRVERDSRLRASHVDCRSNADCSIPNDPGFSYQWALQNDGATLQPTAPFSYGADIAAPLAWKQSFGSSTTRVAVLDTGIDTTHEDLVDRVAFTATAFADDGSDINGHGTHVAGIIGASTHNAVGIAGIARTATLLNIKTLDDAGETSCSIAAHAIVYAADQGADVINASFGTSQYCATLESAVNYAYSNDTLVIAAAGNSGTNAREYPAAFGNAVAVAATTNNDDRASFSNYGADWVDLAAPGQDIISTMPGGYAVASGTSQAAPYAAGIAALIWSSVPDSNGNGLRADDVAHRLALQADWIPGTSTNWRYGRVNACRALAAGAALCPAPPPTPAPTPIPPTPAPAPAPAPAPPPSVAPADGLVPTLSKSKAKRAAHRRLTARYKTRWTRGRGKRLTCRISSSDPTRGRCRVSWRAGRYRYKGTVTIRSRSDRAPTAALTVRRHRR